MVGPAGCVLVPTMGALHAGHGSLIKRAAGLARARGLACVATVFVNPTQFNESSDLERYPSSPDADALLCEASGADAVFIPSREAVYPPDMAVPVPRLPAVATKPGLEDRFRPGHFAGVCQVVTRLFEMTNAAVGVFGEKDWQQLRVVSEMPAGKLVEIVGVPTTRERDGVAMSSRNLRLSDAGRAMARAVPGALAAAKSEHDASAAESAMMGVLRSSGLRVEYAVVRESRGLVGPPGDSGGRALIAAWAEGIRLIDNAAWGSPGE